MSVAPSPANNAQRYAGQEKRSYPRIPANYPICVRFSSPSGEQLERYAQTKNVSAEGVFFSCINELRVGTEVDVLMGIPAAYAASVPAAQLDGCAVVVRSGPVDPLDERGFGANIALRFLEKPRLSTEVSMFD